MVARQPLVAGVIVAVVAVIVLLGWAFDVTFAKSVVPGWRVMVPSTAISFVFAGLALVYGSASGRPSHSRVAIVRALGIAGAVFPALTLFEYVTGTRLGLENWIGFTFAGDPTVAGRMSPLASLCLVVLCVALVAVGSPGRMPTQIAEIASGATLMLSWLAVLAVSFDTNRLFDAPRFPGMAALTILLMAVASAGTLELSMHSDRALAPAGRMILPAGLLASAFLVPLALGGVQLEADRHPAINPQVVTAVVAFTFATAVAAVVWTYAARLTSLQAERERALALLEQRVSERTHELATSNKELRKSDDRLRDADRRKDEFLATLAHELRNPLAPIRNAVAVLQASGVAEKDRQESRLMIDRQVDHMVRLIDDLLDVSRITAGKLPMRKARVQLADILNLAIETARPHLQQAHQELTVSLPAEPMHLEGDSARLAQVFANLLHNASKYTEPGGQIALTARITNGMAASPERGSPEMGEPSRWAEVSVRDNGIGIPAEFLPRLFEKFSQVAPALDRSQGGLGLGLSLVHGIVSLHGGQVLARSGGAGAGSEFLVRLPLVSAAESIPVAGVSMSANPAVSRRVLVVDDNEDSAESLTMLLRLQGHLVESAHDGRHALETAERFHPDVVLLDIGMPGMNGYEVCREIRKQPWGSEMLLIAQTGWGQDQDRQRTKEAGFDGHLTKPIDHDRLEKILADLSV
ncbi:MAG: response regulator [Acidobacteriota bacterium]|nr:response regulator [Acidobacteriota bacterium]